ncbi:phosphoribosylaminoimidazolesuccinocarboxamide synthase [Phytoactinopolyspora sp. XMNu-373]|uniref:Phosphoribosylaminoimidazole-succinocarboxamide synthase n=1 Tax=Phytoactinopolyspora mesophila TaxID=2650750 RepID=A0A7K3MCS8_9ACTN|nr:phosphoribosylaminoimidazolesuccinocarboxamide synthase [Phytoactinopolyspora mesophila]NDL60792.1 phosphoribosylaminoimidazolesuccinocarboxamide synthase [Phytoactinopolyspora mesophila]
MRRSRRRRTRRRRRVAVRLSADWQEKLETNVAYRRWYLACPNTGPLVSNFENLRCAETSTREEWDGRRPCFGRPFRPAGTLRCVTAPPLPGYRHVYSGKVRDLYEPEDDNSRLLIVASDRISAYDYVLASPIPDKGRVLTAMSLWWFEQLADVLPNHVVSADVPDAVAGRGVLVEKLTMVPVECIARGYLTGSGLVEYRQSETVSGIALPAGLVDGSRLDEPIFTPTTKAEIGEHDESVDFSYVEKAAGTELANKLRQLTLEIYSRGEAIARQRGIVLADTKVEFGLRADGTVVLADEVLTPDSSRFWPLDSWQPGRAQPSFDKQFVRDWLTSASSGWNRASGEPPPPLPDEIVQRTRARYVEAYERLTGHAFV